MEHKSYNKPQELDYDYSFEIVGFLLREKTGHIRGIARALKINHMAVARKIELLVGKNVVDFKREGKNKVFFLKESLESHYTVLAYENYKTIRLIKKYPLLRGIVDKIKSDSRLKFVLIFGSYAKLIADKNSDVDIFIETGKQELRKELLLFSSKLSIKIGRFDKNSDLGKEIIRNHVIIKGVEQFYEKY